MIKLIRWWKEEKATALTETVVLFPVLMALLMGVYDLGQGIVINQKVINSSQIMADLIARYQQVTAAQVDDITDAGQLALEPYSLNTLGYDIASVRFDEDGDPEVLWRITAGMEPNDTA